MKPARLLGLLKARPKPALALAVLAAGALGYWQFVGFGAKAAKEGGERGPAPVLVAEAARQDMAVTAETIGSVQAFTSVSIKSQVDGQVTGVHFREGQTVKKGELLFSIDRRPFEAALRQAEANLARDSAMWEKAKLDLARYQELVNRGVVAKQQFETARANADGAGATVKADEAAVERARLELAYAQIHAPVQGRTGNVLIQQGNVVKANDANPLVVINQVQPIFVAFSVPERLMPGVKSRMTKGGLVAQATAPGDSGAPLLGRVEFMNNAVDASTGMIQLKAVFENANERLTPGQSVNVLLTLGTMSEAVTVPSSAVLTGPKGAYVYIVKDDMTVEHRLVSASVAREGKTVIDKGVDAGEKVVTEGQLRLFPGAKIKLPS